jgi:peptidoglycan biosynthesis protein MviN/MurJ (putative lipid II flippase)
MLPRVLIGASFLINLLAITNVNSQLGEGAISAFAWGIRFIDIPEALLGTAIGIVIFPTLSALSAMNRVEDRLRAFSGAMRFILVATIPASAGLVLVSEDALRVLFNADETARIFTVIQVMSLAIVFQSLHEVLSRSFYAGQDTFRPLIFSAIATAITVITVFGMYAIYDARAEVVGLKLIPPESGFFGAYSLEFIKDPPLSSLWAVGGPAFGYVVSFAVETILLGYFLRQRWGDIALPEMIRTASKTLAATGVMVAAVVILDKVLVGAGFDGYSLSHILIRIIMDIWVGGLVFLMTALLIGLQELRTLPGLIFRRKMVVGDSVA